MLRYLSFALLSCLLSLISRSQSSGDSYIQYFSTENGLPSNGIKAMHWDEETGFLWLATEAGIVRFNGVDFKIFTNDSSSGISTERIWFMTGNSSGMIYTADMAGNIFTINRNTLKFWQVWRNSSSNPVGSYRLLSVSESFFNARKDNLSSWKKLGTFNKVLPLNDSACLVMNSLEVFFLTRDGRSLYAFDKAAPIIKNAFKIGNDCFLIDDENRILHFDPISKLSKNILIKDENGIVIPLLPGGIYWEPGKEAPVLINAEKAWLLSFREGELRAEQISAQIPTDAFIQAVKYSKRFKSLFIATDSRGLIVIREYLVQSRKRKDHSTKRRNAYYAQVVLSNGNILTNEGDVIGDGETKESEIPIKGPFNFTISLTGDTLLWFIQYNHQLKKSCLHNYNYRSRVTKVFGNTPVTQQVVFTMSLGKLYMATNNSLGIIENDSLRFLTDFRIPEESALIYDMKETDPGILMIATCNSLFSFDVRTQTLTSLLKKENFCVRTVWKYKDYLFFGTYGNGFYIRKGNQIKAMPLDKNRYLLYTHCFMPDNAGYCWISTNRGLFKARLDELINAYENDSKTVYYHYFGKKDGMEMTELNGGCTPCAVKFRGNMMSFPTMDGLLWVNPDKAVPVLPSGDIYIDDIIIDNKRTDPLAFADTSLPAGTGEIIFRLAFSAWCNIENVYLDYQLNDTLNWKPVNFADGAAIRFNNLPSGDYYLRIRKLNGYGFNNYTYLDIRFSIIIPWYNRWWFFVLVSLALFGLVLLYLQIRTRQYRVSQQKLEKQVAEKTSELMEQNEVLEKNNTIKTRLISIISHDIVTPLKFVNVAGQNLIEKRKIMPEELQLETLREMTNTAQELQLLSTNILNWIKYQNENRRLLKEDFNLHNLVNQVLGIHNNLANQKKLHLVNKVDPGMEVHQFSEPLKIIIYNLVANAINFSEKGSIVISAKKMEGFAEVEVTDEGVGMTQEQIKNIMADQFIISSANIDNRKGNGLGYLIIKDLVKMMDAKMNINSEKGTGSKITIQFPLS